MFKTEWVIVTLISIGAGFGALFGFWPTLAIIASILILRSAKKHWKERPKVETNAQAEPQPA